MRFALTLAAATAVCLALGADLSAVARRAKVEARSAKAAASPSAHHSHGQYAETFTDIEGIVKEVHLLVPHSWIYLEVAEAGGTPQVWALEATSRGGLERVGIARGYIKAGDKVKARCHPLRDKNNGCLLGFLKAPDGTVKDWDGGNAPAPKDF